MEHNLLFWVYMINSVFLINHEIDSAYWNEWTLFKLKGGINSFLIIHLPLIFLLFHKNKKHKYFNHIARTNYSNKEILKSLLQSIIPNIKNLWKVNLGKKLEFRDVQDEISINPVHNFLL